ncbi:TPA: hypothetical protein ACLAQN_002152, partial [Neisseria meningitidis]
FGVWIPACAGMTAAGVSVFSDRFLLRRGLDSRFRGNDGGGGFGFSDRFLLRRGVWIPAFAGMTKAAGMTKSGRIGGA